nr:hypothetical protein BSM_34600 [uncultured archaeon]
MPESRCDKKGEEGDERREMGEGREGIDSQRLTVPYSIMKKFRR